MITNDIGRSFDQCGDLGANSSESSTEDIEYFRSNRVSPTLCCSRWCSRHKLMNQRLTASAPPHRPFRCAHKRIQSAGCGKPERDRSAASPRRDGGTGSLRTLAWELTLACWKNSSGTVGNHHLHCHRGPHFVEAQGRLSFDALCRPAIPAAGRQMHSLFERRCGGLHGKGPQGGPRMASAIIGTGLAVGCIASCSARSSVQPPGANRSAYWSVSVTPSDFAQLNMQLALVPDP